MKRKVLALLLSTAMACTVLSAETSVYAAEVSAPAQEMQPSAVREVRQAGNYYNTVEADTVVDGYYILKVSSAEMKVSEQALKNALQTAGENATAALPYKVVVEPGTYMVNGLSLVSNTYLYLEGVTLKRNSSAQQNLLRVGYATGGEKGYCYENITIYGGVVDLNNGSNTAVKVGHASNFVMENLTLQNIKDAHFMEVAGVNGFTMRNCVLKNQATSSNAERGTDEAVQFDVLVKGHINGYEYEDLTSQNILIEGCTFTNLSKGIGAHNAVLNNQMHDIQILNNTFSKLKSAAISFMDCRNCTVSGNTITNAPRGVALYGITGNATYFGTSLSKNSKTPKKYIKPAIDQNIVITNNTINCSGSDAQGSDIATACVALIGYNISKPQKQKDTDTVPKGDYYISGVTVSNNTMTTTGHGIQLSDTKNTTLDQNVITVKGSAGGKEGIRLDLFSTDNTIVGNTVKNAAGCGIGLYNGSSAKQINGNNISKPKDSGIMFYTSKADEVNRNVITKPKNVGIVLAVGSDAKQISGNKISSASAMGINIADVASDMEISLNTVKSCNTAQIYVQVQSKKNISINDNTIIGKSGTQGIWAATGNVSVTGNHVKKCYHGILVNAGVKATVGGNQLSGNAINASIGGKEPGKALSAPIGLKASKVTAKSVQLSWGNVNGAAGYIVYRSDAKNGSYTKVAQTKKASFKNSKLSGATTYYYKVAAYTGSGELQFLGDFGGTVAVTTK